MPAYRDFLIRRMKTHAMRYLLMQTSCETVQAWRRKVKVCVVLV